MTEENSSEKALLDKIADLTLALQKEVKELKEDTCVNAYHIKEIKEKHEKNLRTLNSDISKTATSLGDFSEHIETTINENGANNYTEFLKSLLQNDFKSMQNEAIEELKRTMGSKRSDKQKKNSIPFIYKLGSFLGIFSTASLIYIIVKFQWLKHLF